MVFKALFDKFKKGLAKTRAVFGGMAALFAGRGNLLLPGTLGPGTHVFAVDVKLADGSRLTAASTAMVSKKAPTIPRQVLGRWTRTVTAAQVARIARTTVSAAADYSSRSLRAKMRAAGKAGYRWVALIDEEEASRRVVQLRDMVSGEQREVAWETLPELLETGMGAL